MSANYRETPAIEKLLAGNKRLPILAVVVTMPTPYISHDQQILAHFQSRNPEAIKLIYRHYGANLLGIILRIVKDQSLAEDVLQESLVKVWKNTSSFDAQKGRLFTWLLNICRNTAIDKTRSAAFRHQAAIQGDDNLVGMVDSTDSYSFNPDQIGIREWVDKLSPEQVEVIDIVYFSGYSHREAAEKLNLPLGTLKTRLRTALISLRQWTKS